MSAPAARAYAHKRARKAETGGPIPAKSVKTRLRFHCANSWCSTHAEAGVMQTFLG